MGNKLCAPLLSKKGYPHDDHPWHIRKDSHLLRLWAEIFRVHGSGDYVHWERVSDVVVPINITCVEDTPKTVFQVTAYNKHVEKIFDVRIIQPGTILCPATECFVHWRDLATQSEWGLNFSTPSDAKRFRDCCSYPSQKFARKASSANSLRLSPPKGRGRAVSSPNSPVNHPRRVVSSPLDLAQPEPCECIAPPGDREALARAEKSATIPRTQAEADQDAAIFQPRGILKPPSNMSVYDNVGGTYVRKVQQNPAQARRSLHIEDPEKVAVQTSGRTNAYSGTRSVSAGPLSYQGEGNYLPGAGAPGTFTSFGKDGRSPTRPTSSRPCESVRVETAFIGNTDNIDSGRKSVTIANLPVEREIEDTRETVDTPTTEEEPGAEASVVVRKDCVRILAPQPQKLLPPESPRSRDSESPEWPSPPEPLTPLTPVTPVCNMDFDSDSIKKMLQNLPLSPEGEVKMTSSQHENDQGFHDDPTFVSEMKGELKPGCVPAERDGAEDCSADLGCSGSIQSGELGPNLPLADQLVCGHLDTSKHALKLLDCELPRSKCIRDSFGRDSNPDSGIGGMVGDGAISLSSGDSAPSNLLGAGLDVGRADLKGGSSGGSSHDGSSCSHLSHSDLINQCVEGQYFSTELSDDEAGSDDSIHTVTEAESQFSYAKQHGAIRKAGWLVVKNWLVQKKKKLELAPKRNWKKYWVCLKGTVLLFFDEGVQGASLEENVPRHILVIEGGIAQAVPEHPKRDHIFSLSTSFGDAYLFQASSQVELDLWVCAIHSACAASFARQHGKDNTIKLLRSELHKLETNIDIDVKMRKMAELQLTVVSDTRSRQAIIKQIRQWEENLEKLNIEQYKMRCYASSLQGSELPNPKVLLASMSKPSKAALGRLGIFTVSSYHALVCARKPLVMPNLYGKGTQKGGLLSPRGDGFFKYSNRAKQLSGGASQSVYKATEIDEVVGDILCKDGTASPTGSTGSQEVLSKVTVPNNQSVTVGITKKTTVQDMLEFVCSKRQLNPRDHYIRVRLTGATDDTFIYPDKTDSIKRMKCEMVEVCQKTCFQVELVKEDTHQDYGVKIEAELADDLDLDDDLRIYVSEVRPESLAHCRGLLPGEEILVINGKIVSELDMVFVETLLLESQSVCLTVRSMRAEPPSGSVVVEHTNNVIDNVACPPPPSQMRISENSIGNLKIPPPTAVSSAETSQQASPTSHGTRHDLSTDQIDALLTSADQVTAICRESGEGDLYNNNRPLSEVEKLRKVIMELIDTERAYVKDLNCLLERYLEPLKEETFMTTDEIDHIFGNIQEIAQFQRQFLMSLEEAVQLDSPFFTATEMKHYRRVLFSLGGSFLFYANHFKVYSSFCASHSRSQKILNPDTINEKLKEFLIARNPKQQHSATLDSYLIKPIQRILKYPLLLQQLCNLTDPDTDEHHHLSEARKGMEAVAEHINEMQKIYEEYGAIFDDLAKMFKDLYPQKKMVDLSVGELQMYGTVEWSNVSDSLGKIKKGTDLESTVFVFKTGVVFLCRERLKRRKSKAGNTPGKGLLCESFETIERFRTLIPVQDVQVRMGKLTDIDNHCWWDLVHSRCEPEGRPERIYQFCNSTSEAKTDFMRIIRQTIRDSVRKMTLPQTSQEKVKNKYIPYGGKRLEALPKNARTISAKRNLNTKNQDVERHSMEFEEKFRVLEGEAVFRVRSKTVGDLNEVSQDDLENEAFMAVSEPEMAQNGTSPGSSLSNLSVSSHQSSSSARLSFASSNPVKHCVSATKHEGSPIWKPRNEANVAKQLQFRSENGKTDSRVVPESKTFLLSPTRSKSLLKDTEC